MSLNVLIVPDKFKGTLTAAAAAEAIAAGWKQARPHDRLTLLPMSDGGDGFGDVMSRLFQAEVRQTPSVNAAHQPHNATWWWEPRTRTAVIESAKVIGLALLPPGKFHPFELDTFGLGAVLRAGLEAGAERCLIGIGGSATNDGGFGMARALGWRFLDSAGREIERWTQLSSLARIVGPAAAAAPGPLAARSSCEFIVAVDVQNPLLGPAGATRIYGPQKGVRPEDVPLAEQCLEQLSKVVARDLELDVATLPGTGAAGGLGFGLRCFLGARLESGFQLFAKHSSLEELIRAANCVITAEGAIDRSTLMGKGVGEVAVLCRKHGVPCLGLAGALALSEPDKSTDQMFAQIYGIAPELTDAEQAKANAAHWLERLAHRVAAEWPATS